ncbi:lysine 6-monooxygenase [Mangrovactinospora gilvigrisea]|uniref:L-lysine N6-monooxygenase MbtG n=1 Tax=Mangrovactinospora gilvigrisea TaxID=1428644 RepID=A0A1J7BAR8_9ACTN|nr:SidA/IucD/PvdA family monooxygenase [Mangrovactinospora gilvigrisea]OIV35693.1 lysine 6-monooxygenase [Mangrovactinospora gilvigrisea]
MTRTAPLDLLGIGIGPFNLSLAALCDGVPGLRAEFLEARPDFRWHPGLLVDGAMMQVPFLADLVSLVDPTSRWSYLAYLRAHDRLFPFYFSERLHLPRREYDHYCRWAARSLPSCRFGAEVTAVRWDAADGCYEVTHAQGTSRARALVLGVGTEPAVPEPLAPLLVEERVLHSAAYLDGREGLAGARDITVLGSGQSGAEIFLDLLRAHARTTGPALDGQAAGTEVRLRWLTRTRAFAPMEYSKLGLEQFTPDHTRAFHALPQQAKDRVVPSQWQLYKAASAETLAEIHDALYERTIGGAPAPVDLLPDHAVTAAAAVPGPEGRPRYRLRLRHGATGAETALTTEALVLATGHTARRPAFLDPLADLLDLDEQGRYRVDAQYRVATRAGLAGPLHVQNAELHTHGVGAPDLGLGAWRAAVILNALAGRTVHRLPQRTAFTTFTPASPATSAAPVASGTDSHRPASTLESDRASAHLT